MLADDKIGKILRKGILLDKMRIFSNLSLTKAEAVCIIKQVWIGEKYADTFIRYFIQ